MADITLARAIVEIGASGVTDTKTQISALEAKFNALKASYAAGTISLKDYLSQSQQLQGQISQLTSGLAGAEAAIKKYGSAAAAAAKLAAQAERDAKKVSQAGVGGGMGGAMGLMVMSQALDDVQYGFRAIVNNIPMMGMALGTTLLGMSSEAATKFGAIAGIAAVAINLIVNHWDQLFQRFGYGTDTMKTIWEQFWGETKDVTVSALDAIETRIKELEAKPLKMAVDMHELEVARKELEELKAGKAAWDQMGKGRSPFEKESGEKVKGLFSEMDSKELADLQNDLVNSRAKAMDATSPAVQKANLTPEEEAKIRASVTPQPGQGYGAMNTVKVAADPAAQQAAVDAERKRRVDESQKVQEANKGKAALELGVLFDKAQKGDAVAQEKLAKALEDVGRLGLAGGVRTLSPEAAADAAQGAKDKATTDAAKAKDRTLVDSLNAQGREADAERVAKRDQEAGRYAKALQPALTRDMTRPGGIGDAELEAKVKDALVKSGMTLAEIPLVLGETVKKLKEDLRDRVDEKMLGGLTREQATRAVAHEDQQRQRGLGKPQAEVMSTESYLSKLLVAGGGPSKDNRDLSESQLKKQTEMADTLAEINENLANMKPGPAKFAGKGGG